MGLGWILIVGAVLAGGAGAYLFASALVERVSGAAASSRVRGRLEREARDLSVTSYGAAAEADSPEWVKGVLRTRLGETFAQAVRASGSHVSPGRVIVRLVWTALGLLLGATITMGHPLPGVVLAVGTFVLPYNWYVGKGENRIERMREQLPDALTLVSTSLGSGLSLPQALEYAARETPAPLGPEFWGVVNDVSAGIGLSEALDRFRERVPLRELKTVSTALEVQRRAGGNTREMLDQATQSVRQRLEMKMDLASKTAQGRLSSRVVGFMPLGILAFMALVSRDYVAAFFGTPVGLAMFFGALLMQVTGFMVIKRIINVKI